MTPLANRHDHRPAAPPSASSSHAGHPIFIVLEGLSCTGKSTIAPLLASRINAVFLSTLLQEYEPIRMRVDLSDSVQARMHFWLMANYTCSQRIRQELANGRSVVVESYFYRTLATHSALGVRDLPAIDWEEAALPDLAVQLTVAEQARRRRLEERDLAHGMSIWARQIEANAEQVRRIYLSFNLTMFTTDGLETAQVVDGLEQLINATAGVGHRD
ncbi:hypothetical protein [Actinomadura sp. 6N118]|uniref:hypothetical protein n=1 Tax=Actinomadura sp. 6N118 TaxID=3375151 RepID=UPI0037A69E07